MAWTPKLIAALLMKNAKPIPATKVQGVNKPARQVSPRVAASEEESSYGRS
jgi:hypothetical protein